MEELCQKPAYEDDILKGIWLPCACYKWLIKCFGSNRFLKEIGHRHYGCQNLTCLPKRKKLSEPSGQFLMCLHYCLHY